MAQTTIRPSKLYLTITSRDMTFQLDFTELPKHVASYLKKFGIPVWNIESSLRKLFNNIVVIPAVQEYENLQALLDSLIQVESRYFSSTLFLFVINNVHSASKEIKEDNQRTLQFFRNIISETNSNHFTREIISSGIHIGIVDAASTGKEIPDKDGGVGLARKIGMDLALTCFNYQAASKKIIICLDADCKVEPNYLTSIVEETNKQNICAGYVEYEHQMPEGLEESRAIVCYELFLRYYVLGLKYAQSPYAFDSIGSTMFCDADYYIKIGGMNKRKAAEDFYFLEKLAKITRIQKISATRVYPSPRKSWRVPFGTGQRMNRYFAGTHDEYALFDPECFTVLKEWLALFSDRNILSGEKYFELSGEINSSLKLFLEEQKFIESWNRIILDSKKEGQLNRQKQFWFDGFRTMKLIHYLRDNTFPNINMFEALDRMFAKYNIRIQRDSDFPELPIQLKYLETLRSLL